MEILRNNEIPLNLWHEAVNSNSFSSPFQTHAFFELFNSVKGLSAEAIAITDSERILSLIVICIQKEPGIKGYFSHRAIIYGGPLIDPDFPDALDLLLKQIQLFLSKKIIYSEIRNLSDYSDYRSVFQRNGWKYIPYINFNLNTNDKDLLIKAISSSRLRQIKKASKLGVQWKISNDINEIKDWYKILYLLYTKKIRKPLLPWDFFQAAFQIKFGKFLLVYYQNKVIGGIFCPIIEGKRIYEFYVCGLDHEFKEQYPSIMATWAALEYATTHSIGCFDFMGAGKKNEMYGVREFKSRFGGKEIEFGRFLKIYKPFFYFVGKNGLSLLQKLKA